MQMAPLYVYTIHKRLAESGCIFNLKSSVPHVVQLHGAPLGIIPKNPAHKTQSFYRSFGRNKQTD